MDFENLWKELEPANPGIYNTVEVGMLERLKSNNPLKKIEKSLKLNIVYGIPVCLVFVTVIYWYQIWWIQLIFLSLLIFSLVVVFSGLRLLKQISGTSITEDNLLGELEFHYNSINSWIRNQQKYGAFFYPVSITGGFFIGGIVGSGNKIHEFITKPYIIAALIVCWLVLTPLCIWAGRKMFHVSFGKYLEQLGTNIEELRGG